MEVLVALRGSPEAESIVESVFDLFEVVNPKTEVGRLTERGLTLNEGRLGESWGTCEDRAIVVSLLWRGVASTVSRTAPSEGLFLCFFSVRDPPSGSDADEEVSVDRANRPLFRLPQEP